MKKTTRLRDNAGFLSVMASVTSCSASSCFCF